MNFISRFFHELLNPHCEHCREEKELERELNKCQSCEVLKQQLEIAQAERKYFFELATRKEDIPVAPNQEPILPRQIPWRVKQQMLESESRIAAQKLAEKNKEIEEEIGIG